MRPNISYTPQGNPYMKNPGSFAFGRAQPKSSDRQQGQLAEPPKQQSQSAPSAASQQQFGSAQASGDYSAYSSGGSYAPQYPSQARPGNEYGSRIGMGNRMGTADFVDSDGDGRDDRYQPAPGVDPSRNQPAQHQGRLHYGPGFADSNGDGIPDVGGNPVSVQQPGGVQRQIDDLKRRGTWDDPRNAKVRERLTQQLRDTQEAPPGYFKTPDGRFEPNYIGYFNNAPPQPAASGPAQASPPLQNSYSPPQPAYTPPQPQRYAPQQYVFPLQGQGPQFYNQRDAFINNINTSLGQQMMQNFGSPQPIAPQLNIPQLWNQAGQMAADGWTNPLAALIGNV